MDRKEKVNMISGEQFRRLRLSRGLSQNDIAKEAGITKNYVSIFENNKQAVSDEVYEKMMKAVYELKSKL